MDTSTRRRRAAGRCIRPRSVGHSSSGSSSSSKSSCAVVADPAGHRRSSRCCRVDRNGPPSLVDDLERKDQSSAEVIDGGPGLTNDDRPRRARPPIGEHTCNRPAHDLPLLISRCIGARSRRERPSRRPVQIRPPNIGTRLAAAACGSCVTRRARRIVCIWAASRCRSSMRAVASARLRWCIGPPIRTRICLSRVLTRPAGETRRRISSISGVAVGVSRDARLRS